MSDEDRPFVLPIVLVGPMAAGKSTLSRALSARLGLPYAPLDWVGFHAMVLDGLNVRAYEAEKDWAAQHRLRLPHVLAAAEAAVRDFQGFVLDFGAGHAHFEAPAEVERIEAALGPLPNVFRVTPAADPEEAIRLSLARDQARWAEAGQTWDESRRPWVSTYVRSETIRRVAKHTIVTSDRDVEDCVDEMVALLR